MLLPKWKAFWPALLGVLAGCNTGRSPLSPADFLRVGVNMEAEAQAVERTLCAEGFSLAQRRQGQTFVALLFSRGEQRALRVVTARGVPLSLDSHGTQGVLVHHPGLGLAADDLPLDLDGDGYEELVVLREGEHARPCLRVLRVEEDGAVREVRVEARRLSADACAEWAGDVDGDGRAELWVPIRFAALSILGSAPRLWVPLQPSAGAFAFSPPAGEMAGRMLERLAARIRLAVEQGDIPWLHRLAVERAALARVQQAPMLEQLEHYDAVMGQLEPPRRWWPAMQRARAFIRRGWRE